MLPPQVCVAAVFLVALKRLPAPRHRVCALTSDRYREKVFPLIGRARAVAITLDMVPWLRRRCWLCRPERCLAPPGHAVKPGVRLDVGRAV